MQRLIRQLRTTIRIERLFPEAGTVVVAVSGGPDSVALLLGLGQLAAQLRLQLVVAHLDHGLRRAEGPAEAARVAELGGRQGLPVEIGVAALPPRRAGANLEEAAREARYAFLAEVAVRHGSRTIAVGHTADDQIETLLMRLLRGAGPRGLAAMTPLASRPDLQLVRPLLRLARSDVTAYLAGQAAVPSIDRSNRDLSLSRNRVRHLLVPLLKRQFNPRIVETLGRTADLMEEIDRYLQEQADRILQAGILKGDSAGGRLRAPPLEVLVDRESQPPKVELDLPRLASYDPILQRYALRAALRRLRGELRGIGYHHIDALVDLCRPGAMGHRVELPGGAVGLRDGRTLSLWLRPPVPAPAFAALELRVPGSVLTGNGITVTTRIVKVPPGSGGVGAAGPGAGAMDAPARTGGAPAGVARASARWDQRGDGAFRAGFDLDAVEPPLVIRSRRPGDRLHAAGLPAEKKVKDLLIEAGVPRRHREAVPILADRRRILWVVGVRRSQAATVHGGTKQVLEVTVSSPGFRQDRS